MACPWRVRPALRVNFRMRKFTLRAYGLMLNRRAGSWQKIYRYYVLLKSLAITLLYIRTVFILAKKTMQEDKIMGFPSPAADFAESRISLDRLLIAHPSATYFLRAGESYRRPGIQRGALLVVDSSLNPCDGSIIVCAMGGEYRLKQYRKLPSPYLENLANGAREELPESDAEGSDAVFGVVTYIINDGRVGEFDDNPVI